MRKLKNYAKNVSDYLPCEPRSILIYRCILVLAVSSRTLNPPLLQSGGRLLHRLTVNESGLYRSIQQHDLPGGDQRLCYNEIPTKVNWAYLRFDFDLETMRPLGLVCNDREFDVSAMDSIRMPAMKNLWCMLNFCLFAETAVDKRAFLYVDQVLISGDF